VNGTQEFLLDHERLQAAAVRLHQFVKPVTPLIAMSRVRLVVVVLHSAQDWLDVVISLWNRKLRVLRAGQCRDAIVVDDGPIIRVLLVISVPPR